MEAALGDDDRRVVDVLAWWPYSRASLIAASLASAPELQKNALSMPASRHSRSASSRLQRHLVPVGGVQQLAGLIADRLGDGRVGVAEPAHGDAGERIEVAAAVGVVQVGPFAVRERHGQRGKNRHLIGRQHRNGQTARKQKGARLGAYHSEILCFLATIARPVKWLGFFAPAPVAHPRTAPVFVRPCTSKYRNHQR